MATKARDTGKSEHNDVVQTSAKTDPTDAESQIVDFASMDTDTVSEKRSGSSGAYRELKRTNKELQVRVRELELQMAGGPQEEGEDEGYGEASDEGNSIIALIKDLHSQIDSSHELKEALETDVASLREKLAKEQAVRGELEAQLKLLEAKAALGEQLREDLSFVEEERNEIARRLEQTAKQLGKITAERDRLSGQTDADQTRIKELESEKIALEANVLNLEETVAEMGLLREQLADTEEELQRTKENAQGLKVKLDATETAKSSLELELATACELIRNQGRQIEEMKGSLASVRAELVDLRAKLDRSEAENTNLRESNKRADHELNALTVRFESVKKELDLNKKALHNIHNAAMRTTVRPRGQSPGA